jgi:hypothetical protein
MKRGYLPKLPKREGLSPTDVWMPMDFDDLGEAQLPERFVDWRRPMLLSARPVDGGSLSKLGAVRWTSLFVRWIGRSSLQARADDGSRSD